MNKVNEIYDDIEWIYNKEGELKKENYDACDSLICALAYINVNHHGLDTPTIVDSEVIDQGETYLINYSTKIWDRKYQKKLVIKKPAPKRKTLDE